MPIDNSDHNGVLQGFTPVAPETVGNGLIQAARSDASLQAFISAMAAATDGKGGAILTQNMNEGSTIQFGYMRDVTQVNTDGTSYTYQQLDPFGQVQANSYSHVVRNTDGGIKFDGNTNWTGSFDQNKVIPGKDVMVWNGSNFSTHDELTLVGIGSQLPEMFDGGKG